MQTPNHPMQRTPASVAGGYPRRVAARRPLIGSVGRRGLPVTYDLDTKE
jgi:hypothetical protein